MKPFTPLRDLVPERLVAEITDIPPGEVCYCIHRVPSTGAMRFIFFTKVDYSQVQPIADTESVPAEFSLEVETDSGLVLTAELTSETADPPFSCTIRSEFPWADQDALACFLILCEQPVWPFIFVSEDCVYILAARAYANPMTEDDLETCRGLIAGHLES
ncbi:MAG TPA: hypothetical protein VD902_01625 [Symbiobacteriaceae bacterium]|nr:hypothetical protein [Symbiobacteriaceae bacterium]